MRENDFNENEEKQNLRKKDERLKRRTRTRLLIAGIFICLYILNGIYYYKSNLNEVCTAIFLILTITFFVVSVIFEYSMLNRDKKIFFSALKIKNGYVKELRVPKREMISGRISEIGNIRRINYFRFYIEKYRCVLTKYDVQRMEPIHRSSLFSSHNYSSQGHYLYKTINNIIEYRYKTGNVNLPSSILESAEFKDYISKWDLPNNFEVLTEDGDIIIKVDIKIGESTEQEIFNISNNVEIYYEKIVNFLLSKVPQNMNYQTAENVKKNMEREIHKITTSQEIYLFMFIINIALALYFWIMGSLISIIVVTLFAAVFMMILFVVVRYIDLRFKWIIHIITLVPLYYLTIGSIAGGHFTSIDMKYLDYKIENVIKTNCLEECKLTVDKEFTHILLIDSAGNTVYKSGFNVPTFFVHDGRAYSNGTDISYSYHGNTYGKKFLATREYGESLQIEERKINVFEEE